MKKLSIFGAIAATCLISLQVGTAVPEAAATSATVKDFPTFGFSMQPPVDAEDTPPTSVGHAAYYIFKSTSTSTGVALLVEVAPSRGATLKEFTDGLVNRAHATLDAAAYKVDGEEAVKLSAPFRLGQFRHRSTLVMLHDDRLYMFSALTIDGVSGEKPLADLMATVHLIKPESPGKHLELVKGKGVDLLGRVTMETPEAMRPVTRTADNCQLSIQDFTVGRAAILVEANQITLPGDVSFESIRNKYSEQIEKQFKMPEPLRWQKIGESPKVYMSDPVKVKVTMPNGVEVKMASRMAMVDSGGGDMLQVFINVPDDGKSDTKPYLDAAEQMIKTMKGVATTTGPASGPKARAN